MAEVLITLGIIGIVAAMTLPALIGKYRCAVVATQLKKLYSVTTQAMLKAMPDGDYNNIPITDGGYNGAKNFFENYLKPQFNIIHICDKTNFDDRCWTQTKTKTGSNYGSPWGAGSDDVIDFVTVDGYSFNVDTWNARDYESVYNFFGVKTSGKNPIAVIHVDANGLKRPNVLGKDVFIFVLSDKGLMPAGSDKTTDEVEAECKTTAKYCFSYIMRNNWKIDPKDAW